MSQNPQQKDSPWLIAGLGNPGARYAGTRHNVGFMALDLLAKRHGLRFSGKQANAEIARGNVGGASLILAKPHTYMNNSGLAVGWLARYYKVPMEQVLVIYDDFDLPLGKLRIRAKGTGGTHNGVKSIIQHLGTQNFPRLRIGVDRPVVSDASHVNWVLGHFSKEEKTALDEVLPRAVDAVEAILSGGIERAMNTYNTDPASTEDQGSELRVVLKEKKAEG